MSSVSFFALTAGVARVSRLLRDRPIIEGTIKAARTCFRPIPMSSNAFIFAHILGVVPLVIATGAGANARRSLRLSIITGMISSTCLAVVLVPAFFVIL